MTKDEINKKKNAFGKNVHPKQVYQYKSTKQLFTLAPCVSTSNLAMSPNATSELSSSGMYGHHTTL